MDPSFISISFLFIFRFRSVAFSRNVPEDARKFAFRNKALHANRDSLNAYVVFTHVKYADAVMACADKISAMPFEGKHLRLDRVVASAADDVRNGLLEERSRDDDDETSLSFIFHFRNHPRAFLLVVSLWVIWRLMSLTKLYTVSFLNVAMLVKKK